MAKKKKKGTARKVARRIKQKAGEIDFMGVLLANAGGFGAAFAIDKMDDMESLADKPFAAPLISEGVGVLATMFLPDKFKPAAYGWIGGSMAQMYRPIMDKIEEMTSEDAPANGTATINAAAKAKRIMTKVGHRMGRGSVRPASSLASRQHAPMRQGSAARPSMHQMGGKNNRSTGRFSYLNNSGEDNC